MGNTEKYTVDHPVYGLNGKPPIGEAFPLGLQHTLAMIVGNMLPAILLSGIIDADHATYITLIQGTMLGAGIATLIQLYPINLFGGVQSGSGLPIMMGMNFVFLGACLSVASTHGIGAMYGAQLVSSIIAILMGLFLIKRLRKIFTPMVSGVVVTCMALGLFSTALKNLAGGEGSTNFGSVSNIAVGLIVAVLIVFLNKYGKGIIKDISILIGIIVGYIICLAMGMVDFSGIADAALFALPRPMMVPYTFDLNVIITFVLIFMVSITDMMGSCTVLTTGAMDRQVTDDELSSTVTGAGLGSLISTLLNGIPVAVFSQNSAITAMNKITSKFVILMGTSVLFISGISPKICAIITTIPSAVIGGATLVVFANILTAGLSILSSDMGGDNGTIAGLAIGTSIGVLMVPEMLSNLPDILQTLLGSSNIVTGAVIAIGLQAIFSIGKSKDSVEDVAEEMA